MCIRDRAQTTLTTADAREMQQADSAVTALTGSEDVYKRQVLDQKIFFRQGTAALAGHKLSLIHI